MDVGSKLLANRRGVPTDESPAHNGRADTALRGSLDRMSLRSVIVIFAVVLSAIEANGEDVANDLRQSTASALPSAPPSSPLQPNGVRGRQTGKGGNKGGLGKSAGSTRAPVATASAAATTTG